MQLPRTAFELKANAKVREQLFRPRTTDALYEWQAQRPAKDTKGVWYLQDGPPYANGAIHMGHALNKILKDVTNRYHLLKGKRIYYKPGWDVHGLPIETKVQAAGENAGVAADKRDPLKIRRAASAYAQDQIQDQMTEMKHFGVMTNWSDIYHTEQPDYEMQQLHVFAELARKGLVYRANKPVHWSPWSRTALADAELEYDPNYLSQTLMVLFRFEASDDLLQTVSQEARKALLSSDPRAVVWTTTPWSLPGNMAMAVNKDMLYSLVQITDDNGFKGTTMWVAAERIDWFRNRKVGMTMAGSGGKNRKTVGDLKTLATVPGSALLNSTYRSSFQPPGSRSLPIYDAPFVTNDTGTGLVHLAPAHGQEDFELCVRKGLIAPPSGPRFHETSDAVDSTSKHKYEKLVNLIDGAGLYTAETAKRNIMLNALPGLFALSAGGSTVRKYLWDTRDLLADFPIQHKYPQDWRVHKPVIVRATPQWFINVDSLKEKAKKALDKVRFVPESARSRLMTTVEARREWCISRQRAWGVPIPVLYNAETDEPLLTPENVAHIAYVLKRKGTNYWWQGRAQDFVAPQYRKEGVEWVKGTDTMDVWLDSGVAWAASKSSPLSRAQGNEAVADLYLEGTDQHRGWFQSSLLTKLAFDPEDAEPTAPYKTVASHGFVLDKKGQKMSKSLGNVITPGQVITGQNVKASKQPGMGTDVLRYWAAKTMVWETDPRFSHLISKHAADDYRAHRTTARFLLSVLPLPEEIPKLADPEVQAGLTLLDRWMLHELRQLELACAEAYESLAFPTVARLALEFDSRVLSALYLDNMKDVIYADSVTSPKRKAGIAVLSQILDTTTSILAPIMPHLAEEIWHYRTGATRDPVASKTTASIADYDEDLPSFFKGGWRGVDTAFEDTQSHQDMQRVWDLRGILLTLIERVRERSWAKKRQETQISIEIADDVQMDKLPQESQELLKVIKKYIESGELADWLQVAQIHPIQVVPKEQLAEATPEDPSTGLVHPTTPTVSGTGPAPAAPAAGAGWYLSTLHNLLGSNAEEEKVWMRITMRPTSLCSCPRCRLQRSQKVGTACQRCQTVLEEIGFDARHVREGEGEDGEAEAEVEAESSSRQ